MYRSIFNPIQLRVDRAEMHRSVRVWWSGSDRFGSAAAAAAAEERDRIGSVAASGQASAPPSGPGSELPPTNRISTTTSIVTSTTSESRAGERESTCPLKLAIPSTKCAVFLTRSPAPELPGTDGEDNAFGGYLLSSTSSESIGIE